MEWTTGIACYDDDYFGEEMNMALCSSPVAQVTHVHS
jgi:hypothetical protein